MEIQKQVLADWKPDEPAIHTVQGKAFTKCITDRA